MKIDTKVIWSVYGFGPAPRNVFTLFGKGGLAMPNGDTGVALANFTQLYGAYKNACDVESVRAAEKAAADAELALATNAKNQADASAEAALTALLAALAEAGITPTPTT